MQHLHDNGNALAYLMNFHVTHIDRIELSGPHADHLGGLVQVMQSITRLNTSSRLVDSFTQTTIRKLLKLSASLIVLAICLLVRSKRLLASFMLLPDCACAPTHQPGIG